MSKQQDPQDQQRMQAVRHYMDALAHGDLATVAAVLSEAEHDPALESLLLTVNRLYQAREGIAVQHDELLQARRFLSVLREEARIGTGAINQAPTASLYGGDSSPIIIAGKNGTIRERRLQPMQIETSSTSLNTAPKRRTTPRETRFPRIARFMQATTAVLIVGALIAGFLFVFAMRHAAPGRTTKIGAHSGTPSGIYINRSDGAYRLNIQTRKVIWHTHVAEQSQFSASPVVIGDSVYITAGTTVSALNAQTGTLRWSHKFSQSVGSPSIDDGLLYFAESGFSSSVLYAVNPATGEIIATYTPIQGQKYWSSPIVVNSVLYYTTTPNLYAVQLPGENLLWQQPVGNHMQFLGEISVLNGVVYTQVMRYQQGKQSQAGFIEVFDAQNGHQLWQSPPLPRMVRTATVSDTMIYAAAFDELAAFDIHTHALIWHQPFNTYSILEASGNLYISYAPNNVDLFEIAALNATTGKLLWKTNNSNGIELTDVLNGVIYGVGWSSDGKEGTVYALNASTGSQLWTISTGVPFSQWGGMVVA